VKMTRLSCHRFRANEARLICVMRAPVRMSFLEAFVEQASINGQHCHLQRPIRDHAGYYHFHEDPLILRELDNLERRMYLVRFNDGAETFVFPDEVEI
jgi:hypothetical protein